MKKLTEREIEVLRTASQHDRMQDVALALFVTDKAIHWHLLNIYKKLRVHCLHRAIVVSASKGYFRNQKPLGGGNA